MTVNERLKILAETLANDVKRGEDIEETLTLLIGEVRILTLLVARAGALSDTSRERFAQWLSDSIKNLSEKPQQGPIVFSGGGTAFNEPLKRNPLTGEVS